MHSSNSHLSRYSWKSCLFLGNGLYNPEFRSLDGFTEISYSILKSLKYSWILSPILLLVFLRQHHSRFAFLFFFLLHSYNPDIWILWTIKECPASYWDPSDSPPTTSAADFPPLAVLDYPTKLLTEFLLLSSSVLLPPDLYVPLGLLTGFYLLISLVACWKRVNLGWWRCSWDLHRFRCPQLLHRKSHQMVARWLQSFRHSCSYHQGLQSSRHEKDCIWSSQWSRSHRLTGSFLTTMPRKL